MRPTSFSESNKTLQKPKNMTDDKCGTLSIFSDGVVCISKWEMCWRERLQCLFRGYIWLWIVSGKTQPPIAIETHKTAFEKNTKNGR